MNENNKSCGNILVIVRSEQKGFYTAVAKILAERHKVRIAADNEPVARLIHELLPDGTIPIETLPERRLNPTIPKDIVSRAVRLENKYGQTMSFLLSGDRNLGRGYLTNIDRYVYSKRTWWSHEKRLAYLVREIECYENLLSDVSVVFMQYPEAIPATICAARKIHYFHLLPQKFGDYYYWGTDASYGSQMYRSSIGRYVNNSKGLLTQVVDKDIGFTPDSGGTKVIKNISYSYWTAIKRLISIIHRDTVNALLRRRKPNSIRMYAWAPGGFRKVRNYRYVRKHAFKPSDLKEYKLAYFPMQMEPEISLVLFAPEFYNVFEAIIWLSKSLPADWRLVVKEQPNAFQFRSRTFYDRLRQIGNVVLADPNTNGVELDAVIPKTTSCSLIFCLDTTSAPCSEKSSAPSMERTKAPWPPAMIPCTSSWEVLNVGGHSAASKTPSLPLVPEPT